MDTTQFTRPGGARIPITMRFPSQPTSPREAYTLELRVTQDDGKNETVRTADFSK